jgi:hypothetical protein
MLAPRDGKIGPAASRRSRIGQEDLQAAAHAIGVQTHVLHANTEQHVDLVFATIAWLRAGGLLIGIDPRRHSASTCRTTLLVRANEMIE